jgi:hypothetical protein
MLCNLIQLDLNHMSCELYRLRVMCVRDYLLGPFFWAFEYTES